MARRKRRRIESTKESTSFAVDPFESLSVDDFPALPDPVTATGTGDRNADGTGDKCEKILFGQLRVLLDRKGRAGKTVTVICGFEAGCGTAVAQLAQELRRELGTGGTAHDDAVELQGDQREKVTAWLRHRGFTVTLG